MSSGLHKSKKIEEAISVCLTNNLTFAAYRLPNSSLSGLVVQKGLEAGKISDLSKVANLEGFLVAPFQHTSANPMFIIKPDFFFQGKVPEDKFEELKTLCHPVKNGDNTKLPYEVSKKEYLEQIEKIASRIKKNEVQKVVLSRVKMVEYNAGTHLHEMFSNLCERFSNAFVYLFNANNQLWMGATPEPFAFLKENVFQTSSVAGTKENKEQYQVFQNWGTKEKQEQQYVSDYISSVLNTNHWENIKFTGPYIKKAGDILHLRTDFTSNTSSMNGNIGHLISDLHPTPAVCGIPKTKALKIIQSVEKHDREYYSGFLGPVGLENPLTLFVNLRCMKIAGSQMILYSGGGLTIDSQPLDEWYETEIKTRTLLSVIHDPI